MSDTEVKSESRARSRSPINRRSRSRSRSPRNDRRRNDRQRPFQGGRRVVLRNIPYELRWQELKDMFRKEVGDVTYVEMLETPEGKSKGVAVVEFKSPDHAKKAIDEFHQKKINDRAIIVREERDKDRQEFIQNQRMRDGGRGGHGDHSRGGPGLMGPGGGLGGISPQVLQQLGIDGPVSSTVFVANLDYKVTWWKLKDVFKLAGNVVKAEIKEDKQGKSRGMGVVTFETPIEAVQAVSMFNGQVLYDRNMIVRVDKAQESERNQQPKLPAGLKGIGMGLGSGGAPIGSMDRLGSSMGGLGGGSGLLGMGGGLGGLGGSGGMGGLGGLGLLGNGGGGDGLLGNPDDLRGLGLGGLGSGGLGGLGSKMGAMSDSLMGGLGGSSLNGNGSLGLGLGGLGRDSMGGMGLEDSLGRDRMGGMDRMAAMADRMMSMDRGMGGMRDNYGSGRDMRGGDDGGRRTTRPDNCTVIVKNLPYSTNWQQLKEHFRDSGDVKFAEIVMDKGRSTGVGYVRFANYEDAHRAINQKHRSRLDKRNIDVALHRN